MPAERLIRATCWDIAGFYTADNLRNAVLRIAHPQIEAASDADVIEWSRQVEADLYEALEWESECVERDGNASDWLELLAAELTAACKKRGLIPVDPAPQLAPVVQPAVIYDEALCPF